MRLERLAMPYPPSINNYYGHSKRGVYIKKHGKQFRKDIAELFEGNIKTFLGRLKMVVHLYPPDKRRRDIDNILKALWDSLEHAKVYKNDSQIDVLFIARMEKKVGGKCVVIISEIEDKKGKNGTEKR